MSQNKVDLANLFQAVTQNLQNNQSALDQADIYNQDHGSNMVQTFQTIATALETKKSSSDSAALAYAAKRLSQSVKSGSGKLYAQNLTRAAGQFKGKNVDEQGALQLLQTLIGSGQTAQGSGSQPGSDMLGALLGGLAESGASSQQGSSAGGGDSLGSLLGDLAGSGTGNAGAQQGNGIDLQDLLAAGMAFMQARQQGQGNLQALVQAFVAGSGMSGTAHRDQSTQVVVQSFLQALSGAGSRQ